MVVPQDTFLNDLSQEGVFCADLTTESLAKAVRLANSYGSPSGLWEARRTFEKQFDIETTRQQLCALLCPSVGPKPRFSFDRCLKNSGQKSHNTSNHNGLTAKNAKDTKSNQTGANSLD